MEEETENETIGKNIEILKQQGDKPVDLDVLMKALGNQIDMLECIRNCGCSCHYQSGIIHCVPCCKYCGVVW